MPRYIATLSPTPCDISRRIDAAADARAIRPYFMPRDAIAGFFGANRYLSNFHALAITADDAEYPTVEHAFQAAKTLDQEQRLRIAAAPTPARAKSLGRQAQMRPDWDAISTAVMLDLTRAKFSEPILRERLLATGTRELIELNYWDDRRWGMVAEQGHLRGGSRLGMCLAAVRDEIRLARA